MMMFHTMQHDLYVKTIETASPSHSMNAGEAGGSEACRVLSRPPFTAACVKRYPDAAPPRLYKPGATNRGQEE